MELFNKFQIKIVLPVARRNNINKWPYDYMMRGFEISLNTEIIYYTEEKIYMYFKFCVLGFGLAITKQIGY